jgi:hypothetical protein
MPQVLGRGAAGGRGGAGIIINVDMVDGELYHLVENEQCGNDTAALVLYDDGTELCETFDSLRLTLMEMNIIV